MQKHILSLLAILLSTSALLAQPANDECINAIVLDDVDNWCSGADAFTTVNATESAQTRPDCFPFMGYNDVWFSFTAQASSVSVSVIGDVAFGAGGTIDDVAFALYTGSCGALQEIICVSDEFNNNQISAIENNLLLGQTYFIRVIGQNNTGTFRLCVNNYNQGPEPSADCPTGVLLCDKSPFTVDFLTSEGLNPNELDSNTGCACTVVESGSAWYKWTCDDSGPLAFTITPQNPVDDIDFVVYELPGGLDNCAGRQPIRCMISGENQNSPLADWIACTGETGLALGDPDIEEACGCQNGDNNFAAAVNMVSGRSYALVIINFSQSGAGFSIEFDQSPGSGTFLGPEAAFTFAPTQSCVGEAVTYTDASSFIGNIEQWEWDFGPGAVPSAADGVGPHSVVYNTPGVKPVLLRITAERGCVVSEYNLTTEVICCEDHFTTQGIIQNLSCPDANNGAIDFSVSNNYGPYTYNWTTGASTQDVGNLTPGTYSVTVRDRATCEDTFNFTVTAPDPFVFDTVITMPTCDGGTDGVLTLMVGGGTPPYEYNWQNTGFTTNNTLSNIPRGDYNVQIRDANGCIIDQVIPVRELELELDPLVQAIVPPTCFGFTNGSITVAIDNGLGPYQFDFNDGNGFVSANTLDNLGQGVYQVTVLDANRCLGQFDFVVEQPAALTLELATVDASCFGEADGSIAATVGGGVGGYTYAWSNGALTALNDDLPAGDYTLAVRDANDCLITGQATINQPDSVGVEVLDVVDNICFGESEGSVTVAGNGGTAPYSYSTDGANFQAAAQLANLAAGTYTITVMDAMGCTATTQATVNQPLELIADAGPDVFIRLGYDTLASAISNYAPVTFEWSPMDSLRCLNANCSTVLLNPTSTTAYTVLVTNAAGCTTTATVVVRVIKDRPIYVPNIFSPNGDGNNDGFTIYGGPALEAIEKLQIFSRWGSLVYQGENLPPNADLRGWDGTFLGQAMDPAVFVYVATLRFIDGETTLVEGDVTLIR